MKVLKLARAGGVAMVLLCAVLPATAAQGSEGRGFYVAADLSMSKFDANQDELDDVILSTFEDFGFDVTSGESDLDDSDIGYSIVLGYSFNQNWAIEGAYMDLGAVSYNADVTLSDGVDQIDVAIDAKVKSSGPAVTLIGSLPLNPAWSVEARVGAYFAKTKITVNLTDGVDEGADSFSDEDTGVILGIGATWNFRPQWALRFGYTHISDGLGTSDVDQLTAGVKWSF